MKSITVLMSTFNGERFIRQQIDSVLGQRDVDVKLIIRDDGSQDSTIAIIDEYQQNHQNITLIKEANIGAEESFNKLCKFALQNSETDFYAFCDQDDVWDADKLDCAIQELENLDNDKPNLYFSNLRLVDKDLNFMRNLFSPGEVKATKEMALLQIFTYGCTCVFNREALEHYCAVERNKTFHDNWIYVICAFLGNVYYDEVPHISYRQHGANLSGAKRSGISLFLHRIKKAFSTGEEHDFENLANQLLTFEEHIHSKDLKQITHVANYRSSIASKLCLFFSPRYATKRITKDLCIRYRIMFNKL